MEKHIQHFEARPDARKLLNTDLEDDEEAQNDSVQLDDESGLKNYFREIVKNANRFGDKLDITHYQSFMEHYNDQTKRQPNVPVASLESSVRANEDQKRRNVSAAPTQVTRHMHNNEDNERKEGEVDDWVPPQDQRGDGKTSLNAKFGY